MLLPFRFEYLGPRRVHNGLRSLDGVGVGFHGPSVLRTAGPPAWLAAALESRELDVALELRTDRAEQSGPARIVTLSGGSLVRNFTVAQKGPDLVVRARREGSDANGMAPLKVDGVFAVPQDLRLEVRFREHLIEILVDGEPRFREKVATSVFEDWDPTYRLALGDEVDGARGWEGELHTAVATVAGVPHDLLADPELERPETFWEIPEQTRRLWRIETSHAWLVEPLHTLIFVVFGVLLSLGQRRFRAGGVLRAALLALVLGTLFQLAKVCFPGRHPSLMHVPFNALGAALGAWLASRVAVPLKQPGPASE
ncbi:hypothetical protein [Planctomycetes bacterium Poly30]